MIFPVAKTVRKNMWLTAFTCAVELLSSFGKPSRDASRFSRREQAYCGGSNGFHADPSAKQTCMEPSAERASSAVVPFPPGRTLWAMPCTNRMAGEAVHAHISCGGGPRLRERRLGWLAALLFRPSIVIGRFPVETFTLQTPVLLLFFSIRRCGMMACICRDMANYGM